MQWPFEEYEPREGRVKAIVYDDLDKREDIETFLGNQFEPDLSENEIIYYRDADKFLNYMVFAETIFKTAGRDFTVMSTSDFKMKYKRVKAES